METECVKNSRCTSLNYDLGFYHTVITVLIRRDCIGLGQLNIDLRM